MKINQTGLRKDLKPFFTQHVLSIPLSKRQASPFLVVKEKSIIKCDTVKELIKYSDNTEVLQTWPGTKRSDVFIFTIGELKKHMEGDK